MLEFSNLLRLIMICCAALLGALALILTYLQNKEVHREDAVTV